MKRLLPIIICIAILGIGIAVQYQANRPPAVPVVELVPRGAPAVEQNAGQQRVDKENITIDIVELMEVLDRLRGDDHADQLADWALYGTLLQAGLSSDEIRSATFDIAPIRHPSLEEVLDFDYGPGRRALLPDGKVWLFYSERDNSPKATLARLADRIRMELGTVPERFEVFRYRTELFEGAIYVTQETPLPSSQLFSPAFGYVEQEVATRADLDRWLNQIDDVTYVNYNKDETLIFGGRRMPEAPTENLRIEDVAALYQAHSTLERSFKEVEAHLNKEIDPIIDAFENLVNIYNSGSRTSEYSLMSPNSFEFAAAVSRLENLLGDKPAKPSYRPLPGKKSKDRWPLGSFPNLNNQELLDQILSQNKYRDFQTQRAAIESFRPRVKKHIESLQTKRYRELVLAGRVPPSEPGFSLDPQWDTQGLVQDLEIIAKNANMIVTQAINLAAELDDETDLEFESAPRAIHVRANSLRQILKGVDIGEYRIPGKWRNVLSKIVSAVQGKSGLELERGGIVPFLELKEELKASPQQEDVELLEILEYMQAKHWRQCARYDGPMNGTRIGMNLFYTDLLAKLWAGLDYYREAPLSALYGFRTMQTEGPRIEPIYWNEIWDLPNTRLWFGTQSGGYKGSPESDGGLRFAHICTRVYAAGSDPLKPGKETTPAENSRRVMGWWDRHYAKVADYEQQYHVQNQIMKWSVITGWMAEHNVLTDLESVAVDRSLRFDNWYTENENLRFRRQIPFLPENEWLGGTECIEALQSYYFQMAGTFSAYIQGGVTLGSSRSLSKATKISAEIPRSLRRSGLDYSKPGLQNIRGTKFELPPASRGQAWVRMKLAQKTRMRAMGAEFSTEALSTSINRRGATGSLRIGMNAGDLGVLNFHKTGNGVKLAWGEGSLSADAKAMQALGKSYFAKDQMEALITAQETFSPVRGDYIVQVGGKSPEVLRTGGGGLGGGGPPPARILRFANGSPGGKKPHLQAAAVPEPDSPLARAYQIMGMQMKEQPLEMFTLPLDEAMTRVNQASWQRLQALPSGKTQPGVVGRVFTDKGPGQNARSIFIQTGDPQLGKLKAFVQDDLLFVKRPATAEANKVFNDFVVRHQITSEQVENVIAAATTGDAQAAIPLGVSTGRIHGIRAGELMAQGKYDKAVAELLEASKSKSLGEAVSSYQQTGPRELAKRLVRGENTSAGTTFAKTYGFESNPDIMLTSVIMDIRASQPQKAAQRLKKISAEIDSTSLSEPLKSEMSTVAMKSSGDYINIRSGRFEGFAEALTGKVGLRNNGFRVHTVLPKKALKTQGKLSHQERTDLAALFVEEPPQAVYVQDNRILNKFDWDGAPESSLQKAMRDPQFVWERLSTQEIGKFRPSVLMEEDVRFIQRPMPKQRTATRSLQPKGAVRPASKKPYIYTVRSCDANGDGTVTKEELATCG